MDRFGKRAFDIIGALVLVLPATCLIALAALAIRIESAGSPLFVQTRVGRHQRPFKLLKLRTMKHGTMIAASHEVGANAITRLGALLRRYKIDELPQVWSVLIGTMSFVGPRPCLPVQYELVSHRETLGVFAVRPGITGRAQVMGIDMSRPALLAQIDADYARERSFASDLAIIGRTITGRGFYDAAVRIPSPLPNTGSTSDCSED